MKFKYKIIGCLLAFTTLGILASCKKDFLGQVPDDTLYIDDVFERKIYIERYLANVYTYIRSEVDNNTSNNPWEGLSDEMDVTYNDYATYSMNLGNWDRNRGDYNYWNHYYRGIRNASFFLQNAIPGRSIDLDENLLKQYRAEARALRAFYYAMLVRQYGPVIIMPDTPVPSDAPLEQFHLPRNSFDECIDYIVSEIDLALPDLLEPRDPAVQGDNTNSFARMSKGVALATKSRILLYAASPLFNGNTEYADFKNPDGKQLISQQFDVNKWKRAADAAKAVIDIPHYSLYKEYGTNGVYNPYASLKGIFTKDWNSEVIMAKSSDMYSADKNGSPRGGINSGAAGVGGWQSWGPTQSVVDAYFMANGHRPVLGYNSNGTPIINPASGYTESGSAPAATPYYDAGTSNMYTNREPRFYVAVTFHQSKWINGAGGATAANPMVISMLKGGNGGKYDNGRNWSRTGYVVRKLVHPGSTVNPDNIIKRTEVKIRLAEIYLNYVEALNEFDPNNSDILVYLNMIRERAGIPKYGSAPGETPVPAGQDAMREAIHHERRVELAFENHRYFDTRRWKIAEETDGGDFYGMNTDATDKTNFLKRTVFETRVFNKKYYLWNIVQSELNANPSLVENPGW
ncbi:RagB/SusD family nutrient uptake outer membrane protein [Arcticibacter sp.]|uniref:RagB/SusD family nutrient uptake outer membrane protein n=1 Tax=Arcticibacter sp. TaxID=1872630 RepID=UPI00388F8D8E